LHFTLSSERYWLKPVLSVSPPAFSRPSFNSSEANQFARQFDGGMLLRPESLTRALHS